MSADKNMLFAAAVIFSGAVAATLGMVMRDRVDLPIRETVVLGDLPGTRVASREDPQGGIDIPEKEYFEQMVEMLKQRYVDPIEDEQKLVSGAVRGMVSSLEDPTSLYMDKDEFRVFQNAREGQYEGIGVDFVYLLPAKSTDPNDRGPRVPKVVVAAVTPGGPAAKAGVKPGDIVDTVDGRWVFNADDFDHFRILKGKVDKKLAPFDELKALGNELRAKSEHALLPAKAKDRLSIGTTGTVKVSWLRAGKLVETSITKGVSRVTPVESSGDGLKVRLMPGVQRALDASLPKSGTVTLDFRNNPFADVSTINEALSALLVKGTYGKIANQRGGSTSLSVKNGRSGALHYKVLVDKSTHAGAALVAEALKASKVATVEGTPAGDQIAVEVVRLPDGSGFTLAKGWYKAEGTK